MQVIFKPSVLFSKKPDQNVPVFDLLPTEIILQITQYLDWRQLLSLEMCSRRLRQILEFFDDKLWKKHFIALRNNTKSYTKNIIIEYSVPFGRSYKIAFVLEKMEQKIDKSILDQTEKILKESGVRSAYKISFYRPPTLTKNKDTQLVTAEETTEYFYEIGKLKRAVLSALIDRWMLLWKHSAAPNKPQFRAGIEKEITVVSDTRRTLVIKSIYEN